MQEHIAMTQNLTQGHDQSVLLMARQSLKVVLRSSSRVGGGVCVETAGTRGTLLLSADNWALPVKELNIFCLLTMGRAMVR
jgi:hypothetical protein